MVLGRDREGYFRRKFNLRTPSTFRRSRQSTILQLLNRLLAFLQIPLVGHDGGGHTSVRALVAQSAAAAAALNESFHLWHGKHAGVIADMNVGGPSATYIWRAAPTTRGGPDAQQDSLQEAI